MPVARCPSRGPSWSSGPPGWGPEPERERASWCRRRTGRRRHAGRRSTHGRACSPTCRSTEGFGLPPVEAMRHGIPWWRAPCPASAGRGRRGRSRPGSTTSPTAWCRWPPTTGCGPGWPRPGAARAGSLTWESSARRTWRCGARWLRLSARRCQWCVLALSLDVSAVPGQPVGAGRYTIDLAEALARSRRRGAHAVVPSGRRSSRMAVTGGRAAGAAPRRDGLGAGRRPGAAAGPPGLGAAATAGPARRARRRRPPRTALHDAREGPVAQGGDDPRPHLPRPPRVARAQQGASSSAGPSGWRPAGPTALVCVSATTAARLEELCAPGRTGVRHSPRGRPRPLPSPTRPAAGSPTTRSWPGSGSARPTSCSWVRSNPARRCPTWWPPSTG